MVSHQENMLNDIFEKITNEQYRQQILRDAGGISPKKWTLFLLFGESDEDKAIFKAYLSALMPFQGSYTLLTGSSVITEEEAESAYQNARKGNLVSIGDYNDIQLCFVVFCERVPMAIQDCIQRITHRYACDLGLTIHLLPFIILSFNSKTRELSMKNMAQVLSIVSDNNHSCCCGFFSDNDEARHYVDIRTSLHSIALLASLAAAGKILIPEASGENVFYSMWCGSIQYPILSTFYSGIQQRIESLVGSKASLPNSDKLDLSFVLNTIKPYLRKMPYSDKKIDISSVYSIINTSQTDVRALAEHIYPSITTDEEKGLLDELMKGFIISLLNMGVSIKTLVETPMKDWNYWLNSLMAKCEEVPIQRMPNKVKEKLDDRGLDRIEEDIAQRISRMPSDLLNKLFQKKGSSLLENAKNAYESLSILTRILNSKHASREFIFDIPDLADNEREADTSSSKIIIHLLTEHVSEEWLIENVVKVFSANVFKTMPSSRSYIDKINRLNDSSVNELLNQVIDVTRTPHRFPLPYAPATQGNNSRYIIGKADCKLLKLAPTKPIEWKRVEIGFSASVEFLEISPAFALTDVAVLANGWNDMP